MERPTRGGGKTRGDLEEEEEEKMARTKQTARKNSRMTNKVNKVKNKKLHDKIELLMKKRTFLVGHKIRIKRKIEDVNVDIANLTAQIEFKCNSCSVRKVQEDMSCQCSECKSKYCDDCFSSNYEYDWKCFDC